MAKKASPAVQFRKLQEALDKLEPEQQLRWMKDFLARFDEVSLVMGSILDSLDYYLDQKFPGIATAIPAPTVAKAAVYTHRVSGTPMTEVEVIETACGYIETTDLEEAIYILIDQGFEIVNLEESAAARA